MNTYLQIAALLYMIMFSGVYFSKKRVNTIENNTFKVLFILIIYTLVMNIYSTIFALYYPITPLTGYIIKMYLWGIIAWIYYVSFYVYCISDPKQAGVIDFKDHPNKKHFKKARRLTIIAIVIIIIFITCLPINVYVDEITWYYDGPTMIGAYIAIGIGILTWIFAILRDIKHLIQRRYIPIYALFLLAGVTIAMQIIIPELPTLVPMAAFITAIMFFTMENPDVQIVENLNKVRSEAEEANQAKTDFLSSMSHEIRTPLNAIVGFGQALAKEDISGTAKEEVQDILMASNTLLDIVNGILDISKIEADKVEIVNAEYNSKKVVNEVTSLINARIGSKPIDFKVLVDENLPPVLYGDSARIKQVMINLLTNAVKYTNEGRILLQIKAENNMQKDICKIEIQVQDTGMGMTEEDVKNLFTKFQRFDMDKNVNVEGTGLGMTITKGLIELMHGTIDVKSTYGEGSTFTVRFEQKIIHKENYVEESSTLTQVKAFNAAGQKVLVVDDNKINLKVAERLLKEYNLTIETVRSGPESIDKVLDGEEYDLIFMDIMMPKMNGIETLENLKNIVGFKMPVVALTADVISGMEEKYLSVGFDGCLAKPIVEEELYNMLKRFLKETDSSQKVAETPAKTIEQKDNSEAHSIELLESNRISVASGLELLKDMEMYEMTLEEFYNELQNKITDLEKYKNDSNMEDYAILAHALKTEARYVGCNELGDMAYEHELAGKEKNQDLVNQKFDELKNEANRVYDVIKRYLGE